MAPQGGKISLYLRAGVSYLLGGMYVSQPRTRACYAAACISTFRFIRSSRSYLPQNISPKHSHSTPKTLPPKTPPQAYNIDASPGRPLPWQATSGFTVQPDAER